MRRSAVGRGGGAEGRVYSLGFTGFRVSGSVGNEGICNMGTIFPHSLLSIRELEFKVALRALGGVRVLGLGVLSFSG